ncbi:MAG: hypothetical protein ABSC51_09125 [Gaiellaceae bacterium]|jgi:hypothetical protein
MQRTSRGLIRLFIVGCAVTLSGLFAAGSNASNLIDHVTSHQDATSARIKVNKAGIALLSYMSAGRVHHILARGAINALAPVEGKEQVEFKLDYKGGWGFFRKADYWKTGFGPNVCGPYQGPKLSWLIYACTMPDGSNWAVQSWQRRLSTYGVPSPPAGRVWELRLSHWNTDLAVLSINLDWVGRGRYNHLWGKYTYLGNPVYGFKATYAGLPLDSWGRTIYLSTYNSAYGPGWTHENAFLTHKLTGSFCYGFYPHRTVINGKSVMRPPGNGQRYRATVVGPGVTPDVTWEGSALGAYDPIFDAQQKAQEKIDLASDLVTGKCTIS